MRGTRFLVVVEIIFIEYFTKCVTTTINTKYVIKHNEEILSTTENSSFILCVYICIRLRRTAV